MGGFYSVCRSSFDLARPFACLLLAIRSCDTRPALFLVLFECRRCCWHRFSHICRLPFELATRDRPSFWCSLIAVPFAYVSLAIRACDTRPTLFLVFFECCRCCLHRPFTYCRLPFELAPCDPRRP